MSDILKNFKVSFRVESFLVTDVLSFKDVIKSIRFYIRATDIYTFHHEILHVINFDVEKNDFSNFIPYEEVTKEITEKWISDSIGEQNFQRIKHDLYDKFYPKEKIVIPGWVSSENQTTKYSQTLEQS